MSDGPTVEQGPGGEDQKDAITTPPLIELKTSTGATILEPPPRDVLMKILTTDPRVSYINPTFERTEGRIDPENPVLPTDAEEAFRTINSFGVSGNAFSLFVSPALTAEIRKFSLKQGLDLVGLRGIACSLDGTIEEPAAPPFTSWVGLPDVIDVMRQGRDAPRASTTNISTFDPSEPTSILHHRTVQWLVDHTRGLREGSLLDSPSAKKVYPVALVYDLRKLQRSAEGNEYTAEPKPGQSWPKALIKAYVMPAPLKV